MQRQCQLPSLQARDQPQREKPLLTRERLFLMLQTQPLPLSESPRGISITTKGITDSFLAGRASPSPWIDPQTLPARLSSTRAVCAAGHHEPHDGTSSKAHSGQGVSRGLGKPRKRSLAFVPGHCPSDSQQGSQKNMGPASN